MNSIHGYIPALTKGLEHQYSKIKNPYEKKKTDNVNIRTDFSIFCKLRNNFQWLVVKFFLLPSIKTYQSNFYRLRIYNSSNAIHQSHNTWPNFYLPLLLFQATAVTIATWIYCLLFRSSLLFSKYSWTTNAAKYWKASYI